MSILIRWFFVCPFALSLFGCESYSHVTPDIVARIKRVAPISMVGNEFERQYVGFTVFGNELDKKDISQWGVDAAYEDQLAQAAQQIGLNVARPSYSAEAFAHVNDPTGPWSAPAYWRPNWAKIEEPARAYCSANSLDALLVVAKSHRKEFGPSNQYMHGVGSFARGGSAMLHVLAVVGLIDCSTGELLAEEFLKRADWEFPADWPVAPLPIDVAKTPITNWSPDMENQIRQAVIQLPTTAWQNTLKVLLSPAP